MKRRTRILWLTALAVMAGCVGEDDATEMEDGDGRTSSAQTTSAPSACVPSGADASVAADAGTVADAGQPAADGGCGTLTYETFGKAFLQQYCVGCHQGPRAPDGIDLTTLANVKTNKREIDAHAVKTPRSKPMPPPTSPQPSAADRAKLGQWLTCGPN